MREKSGITLIALIITIIVLLILAGVSISLVVGDNGLLTQAQESKINTEKAQQQEYKQLTIAHAGMNLEGYTDEKTGVYIPSGFAVSENPKEQTLDEGLVVIDKFGDEFVWIPATVDNFKKKASSNGKYGGLSPIDDDTIRGLTDNYGSNPIITSNIQEITNVTTAGGFFVSRYEIGANRYCEGNEEINYYEAWSATGVNKSDIVEILKSKLNSKQGYEPVRVITQDECLALANNWKSGKDYQSGLITGTTWDRMVSFICDDNTNSEKFEKYIADKNSTNWGNYNNNLSITYKQIFRSSGIGADWQSQTSGRTVEGINSRFIFPTGEFISSDGITTSKKNVYDVAGNVWEWTTEVSNSDGTNRVNRGGSGWTWTETAPATYRLGDKSGVTGAFWDTGFRVVLYVINPNNP